MFVRSEHAHATLVQSAPATRKYKKITPPTRRAERTRKRMTFLALRLSRLSRAHTANNKSRAYGEQDRAPIWIWTEGDTYFVPNTGLEARACERRARAYRTPAMPMIIIRGALTRSRALARGPYMPHTRVQQSIITTTKKPTHGFQSRVLAWESVLIGRRRRRCAQHSIIMCSVQSPPSVIHACTTYARRQWAPPPRSLSLCALALTRFEGLHRHRALCMSLGIVSTYTQTTQTHTNTERIFVYGYTHCVHITMYIIATHVHGCLLYNIHPEWIRVRKREAKA